MNRQTKTGFFAGGARMIRNATLLLLVGAGAFAGCKQGRGDRCQQDSDCGSGLFCGSSCTQTTVTCICEPIPGLGSGGTTVIGTGGTSGTGGAGGTPDQGQGGGGAPAGEGGGGASGDTGGAGGEATGGEGGGGGVAAGGESGAAGGASAGGGGAGGGAGSPAGGAGGA